jgi:hypothetical protein
VTTEGASGTTEPLPAESTGHVALPSVPSPTTAPPPPPPGTAKCATADLRLSISRQSAAAGNEYSSLVFTNAGAHACSLVGYPGVSVIGADGSQIGSAADHAPGGQPATITLAPGAPASALLDYHPAGNFDAATCGNVVTGTALRVYPPGNTQALTAPSSYAMCTGAGMTGQLIVQPVVSGTEG